MGALLLLASLLCGIWYLSISQGSKLLDGFLVIVGWGVVVLIGVVLVGLVILVISLFSSRSMGNLSSFAFRMLDAVYPLAVGFSKTLHLDPDNVRRSYVEVHNQATKFGIQEDTIKRILILAPHCIQKHDCPHKITLSIDNCRRCGQCPVDGLIRMAGTWNVTLAVATGGTLAREWIKRHKPDAVVAIACERDLVSGIQDVTPLTVIGVLNDRPFGPCHDTQVDFTEVEAALRTLRMSPSAPVGREHTFSKNLP